MANVWVAFDAGVEVFALGVGVGCIVCSTDEVLSERRNQNMAFEHDKKGRQTKQCNWWKTATTDILSRERSGWTIYPRPSE